MRSLSALEMASTIALGPGLLDDDMIRMAIGALERLAGAVRVAAAFDLHTGRFVPASRVGRSHRPCRSRDAHPV